jgi:nitrate reductase NapAB chaperone NapD
MTVVGIIVRAEAERFEEVRAQLAALEGVQTIELEEPGCLGLVLEADGLKQAHDRLRGEIERTPGVLTAWPVQVHHDSDSESQTHHEVAASL